MFDVEDKTLVDLVPDEDTHAMDIGTRGMLKGNMLDTLLSENVVQKDEFDLQNKRAILKKYGPGMAVLN